AVGQLPVFVPPTAREGMPMRITGLAFSPDGATLAAAAAFGRHPGDYSPRDARVYSWDLRTGREVVYAPVTLPATSFKQHWGLAWAADGSAWLLADTLVVDAKTG